ncbi:uncharacterized protein LOC130787413 [Actinidia eriantha]|uniref:uncharacterized protein LOC130787413 n=1 Tax=Actinidia eriantha TaxID=165200 RepID=UPI0025868373|nr:uncharacterized protein LOC130787413 [Actinidia eriantha]XP_057503771.1 uncharacterized protein LOC130787413 [Actinidia eriantha]XP_057503773.1 uncharacterized protein LOC130787413 [Actinidia eriantha]
MCFVAGYAVMIWVVLVVYHAFSFEDQLQHQIGLSHGRSKRYALLIFTFSYGETIALLEVVGDFFLGFSLVRMQKIKIFISEEELWRLNCMRVSHVGFISPSVSNAVVNSNLCPVLEGLPVMEATA